MLNRPLLWISAVAALSVGLSACSGGSATTATTSPATKASTSTTSSTPTTPQTTSATSATSASRDAVALKSALLELKDLPSGFAIDPAGTGADNGGSASSKDPKCAALVKLTNAKTAPGSKASAELSFSGGQDGPFVDESIDALGSADAVVALQTSLKSAVAACRQVVVTISGQGSSTMKVAEVSAPKFGDHTIAARMTATGGPLAGLEITQVAAGVNDVIVSLSFVLAAAQDVDSATEAAVGKAQDVLGVAPSGT
jgi:hypothetical protein